MALADWKLSILTFPQYWDNVARRLDMRVAVLPRDNPLEPLLGVPAAEFPPFADAELTFELQLIDGLEELPDPTNARFSETVSGRTPPGRRRLYEALAQRFPLAPVGTELPAATPRREDTFILKYLPRSYRTAFAFAGPRTEYAFTDDRYQCSLRTPPTAPPSPPSRTDMRWGQVIAGVLPQPRLAERLGLVYQLSWMLPEDAVVQRGGWLFVRFASGTTYSALSPPEPGVRLYAARIPPLESTRPRTIFAPVLFPVPAPDLAFDDSIREAQTWDDGFAKIVHYAQPRHADLFDDSPEQGALVQDAGIQLGWDDEQLVIWFNRLATPDPMVVRLDSPVGVHGYRVDVRRVEPGEPSRAWTSLARVEGDLRLGTFEEHFVGEHALRVAPIQLHGLTRGDYWMPSYFARWNGKSLSVGDDFASALRGASALPNTWTPVGLGDVPLRYGNAYQFRVRLVDWTGGGPTVDRDPVHAGEAPITTCRFRRYVPPKAVRVDTAAAIDPDAPATSYRVWRPVLGYPGLVYTGYPDAEDKLLADAPQAQAEGRELGLPDPDVTELEIEVAVLDPALGGGPEYRTLYTGKRLFPSDAGSPLDLQVAFRDVGDVAELSTPAATGALQLPTARDVRLRLVATCRSDPNLAYFGSDEARRGAPVFIQTRAHSRNESDLFPRVLAEVLAHMLQPDPAPDGHMANVQAAQGREDEAPTDVPQRLAEALDLDVRGLRFFGSGRSRLRTVFGCSGALSSVLSSGNSAIGFASRSELTHQWITTVSLIMARDWTWDALGDQSLEVTRRVKRLRTGDAQTAVVGALELRRAVHHSARDSADPSRTRLVFLDAIDPKPPVGEFPSELEVTYTVQPRWKRAPVEQDAPFSAALVLPVATRPSQTPKLASAGIGSSPYDRSAAYDSSEPRRRALWLEFTEPVADPRDTLFARVLAYAPDPVLTGIEPTRPPTPAEPPLPIPSELIRTIAPAQSRDTAGLGAMQKLIATDSPRHFYLPLPPGLSAEAPELFGFFTYELRVGHFDGWSTASARFGPPLRSTGIQHPPPWLVCQATRRQTGVLASAGYAVPVAEQRRLQPRRPNTEIWGLLYTQVAQMDGSDHRNVLLSRQRAEPLPPPPDEPASLEAVGIAHWDQQEIDRLLRSLALPANARLSVLAVELIPMLDRKRDPLGGDLGHVRILRTSPLVPVPDVCL